MSIILYALVTPALFYLGSRAVISRPLWSRYPAPLARFADCSACTGFWYGALAGAFGGYYLDLPFLGLEGASPITVLLVGLCSMTWTPIIASRVQLGFEALGSAVEPSEEMIQPFRDALARDEQTPGDEGGEAAIAARSKGIQA